WRDCLRALESGDGYAKSAHRNPQRRATGRGQPGAQHLSLLELRALIHQRRRRGPGPGLYQLHAESQRAKDRWRVGLHADWGDGGPDAAMKSRPATGGGGLLRFMRRRPRTLAYKLSIPSILGTLLLLVLGGSVGLAFLQVSAQARTLV